ncbi:hypothetical protein [Bartonella sp. DGB2]|uniref:hypothetical protein n=1 Tax=Bartonella sp. DGB2 TaxID=3388426 RepID=UPI00398FBB6B
MITGMAFTLIFFVPAFYSAFLLGLAYTTTPRQTVNDATITHWYPLSSILFRATLCIALTTSLFILAWLYSDKSNGYAENFTSFIMNSLRQWQNFSPGDLETIQAIIYTNALMIIAIGLVFYSTLFFIANLYTSTLLGHKLKRMARPREDWPLQFRLPLTALVIYVTSFIASFLDLGNEVNLVINIVNTAFTDMLLISGLAYLHAITRGIKLRIAILSLIYFLLFTLLLTPPILILILLMGLWSSIQYSRNPRGFS